MKVIRSKAPLRISFSGGGTDVPPYPKNHGGCVLSSTINKYAYVSLIPREDNDINIYSLDFDILVNYDIKKEVRYNGELDLVKGVLENFNLDCGLDMYIHTDAPSGSGLGSSSAIVVAVIGAVKHWLKLPLTRYEIADKAYNIERKDLKIEGGIQDQYSASFGGFNFIEFNGEHNVTVNPLRIDRNLLNELGYSLILCYTGETRLSANIIKDQVENYKNQKEKSIEGLNELKKITYKMKDEILKKELDSFGKLLNKGWENKKKLSSKISNSGIDKLYKKAKEHGAAGGKLLGAGGGGFLLLYCPFNKKHLVSKKLEKLGGKIVDFDFDKEGLQTWDVSSNMVKINNEKNLMKKLNND